VGVETAPKHMAELLEKALDIALERKDPKKKLERRRKRQGAAAAESRLNEVTEKDEPAKSRYVASEVRGRVHGPAFIQLKIAEQRKSRPP